MRGGRKLVPGLGGGGSGAVGGRQGARGIGVRVVKVEEESIGKLPDLVELSLSEARLTALGCESGPYSECQSKRRGQAKPMPPHVFSRTIRERVRTCLHREMIQVAGDIG